MPFSIPIKILPHGVGLPLPRYSTAGSAGIDLCAAIQDRLTLIPGETQPVPTGIAIAIPEGYEGQVRPRSGLARKSQIGILNSPGTVDSDYRGEVQVLLTNFSQTPFTLQRGDRIAQLVITKYETIEWDPTDELPESGRGEGGFGHTGR